MVKSNILFVIIFIWACIIRLFMKPVAMRRIFVSALLFLILSSGAVVMVSGFSPFAWTTPLAVNWSWERGLAHIPGGRLYMGSREGGVYAQPGTVDITAFLMGRHPVTVSEFVDYLNAVQPVEGFQSPQIERRRNRYRAVHGTLRLPVTHVSRYDALGYCAWLSERRGMTVRLPSESEWEWAARGGIRRARYPWGWGKPEGRAVYNADGPVRVGSYTANAYGLFDMAGNVFEWCVTDHEPPREGSHPARGGSWAERDPGFLRVFHRTWFPAGYRDADVGFRIAVDLDNAG